LLDVGTGAGFPGIPLKIASPSLIVTLVDGTNKKIRFLEHVVDDLALKQVNVIQGRAEEIGPLTRLNGFSVIFKGSNASQEFIDARKAIDMLGGEVVRMAPVTVPYLNQERFVILIKKVQQTPNRYPRGQGLARKSPLG